jgi:hypothetical protein
MTANIARMENALQNLMEHEISHYKVSDMELKGDPQLIERLKNLCTDNVLFVFKFGDMSCDICVDDAFMELSKFKKFDNNEQFMIITNFQDFKKFKAISNLYKDKYSFINIEYSTNLYLNKEDEILPPVFFILIEGDLIPQKIFFYFKELPKLNQDYFELINSIYFAK